MSQLALTLKTSGPDVPYKIVARLLTRSPSGPTKSETVLLDFDKTTTVEIDPGQILVQVQLPSGVALSEERTISADRNEAIVFNVESSRSDWLNWHDGVSTGSSGSSGSSGSRNYEAVDSDPGVGASAPRIEKLRVHRRGGPLEVPLSTGAVDGNTQYTVDADERTVCLTITQFDAPRPFVELIRTDGTREIIAPPLPWYSGTASLPVQMISELCSEGTHANVYIHDPDFSPMLAYYAAGNLSAARDFAPVIIERAESAMSRGQNPLACVAGMLVLWRLAPGHVSEQRLEHLAGLPEIAEGPILYATHLMARSEGRGDRSRVRRLLLEACKRGVPTFASCGRMLRDALTRLARVEPDEEVIHALEWARDLVDASRSDTIITWLSADDQSLSRLVPDVVRPPTAPEVPATTGTRSA